MSSGTRRRSVGGSSGTPILQKTPTGIAGLDELTGGGLPQGRPTLVCGSAGSGKTLLAMEFLVRGATEFDEPGVFIAFEEQADELTTNFASLGDDLASLVKQKKLALDFVRVEPGEMEETGEYDLDGLFIRLEHAIDGIGAKRVVLDTIEALFSGLTNEAILRAELRRLFRWLKDKGVTAIVTAEQGEAGLTRHGLEEYVADCVILLDNRVAGQMTTRRLRVVKYRGSSHGTNEYPFLIDEGGISIMPLTSLGMDFEASTERVSTGVARLDSMLGGLGYYRGSSVLVSGIAGTGKTSLAAHFARGAAERGERCLWFAFEESPSQSAATISGGGEILSCDASLARTLGRPIAEVVGTHMADHLAPQDTDVLGDVLAHAESDSCRRKVHLATSDGHLVPVYLSASVLRGPGAQQVSCLVCTDLEDVVSAEEALRGSEERYRALIELAPVGIGVLAHGTVVFINSTGARLLGADSPEQVVGMPIAQVLHPDGLEAAQSRIRRMMSGEEGLYPVETVCLRLDGTPVAVELAATPLRFEGNSAVQVIIVDITRRKKAEEDWGRSQSLLAASMDSQTGTLFFAVDRDYRYLYFNRTHLDTMKAAYGKDIEVGMCILDCITSDEDRKVAKTNYDRALMGESHSNVREFGDVQLSYYESFFNPVRDEDGQIIGATGLARDITERMRAEEELRETRDYLENLFGYANAPIIVWDPDLRITRFNGAFEQLSGRSAEEVVGEKLDVLFPRDRVKESLDLAVSASKGDRWQVVEIEIVRADGAVRTVLWNSATVSGADGTTPIATIAQGQDITGRKQAEQELRQLNRSLEERIDDRTRELNETVEALTEADLAKTRFLRSMSHELRTPLNSVIGFSSMLADGIPGEVNEEQHKQLAMIKDSGKHLLNLINDILDLSRIEAGAVEIHPVTIDVPSLLDEVVASVRPTAEGKGLEVTLSGSDHPLKLMSDLTKVHQILLNLLNNAVKFTEAGSVVLSAFEPSPGLVAFSVTDTGPGIAPEQQERIFGEFERSVGASPSVEGTGLGLAISRGLASSLGGTLDLVSEVGEGSTFTLTLPETIADGG